MSNESGVLTSLPDAPLSHSGLEAIDGADGVRRAISVTWKESVGGFDAPDEEHTDDIIVITDGRVRYLSREPGEGWTVERDEHYADDEKFEDVMDDVHDYAVEYSREKLNDQVNP